jgi:futalosine hydrolase
MDALRALGLAGNSALRLMVTGVGPVETAFTLSRCLERDHTKIRSVVNFGIGGAYLREHGKQIGLLDICLAEREVLGDFGVCFGNRVEPFPDGGFGVKTVFRLDEALVQEAETVLAQQQINAHTGTFVTVNGASGTRERAEQFRVRYDALCENMEGAAAARVCENYDLPLLEVRAISNLVEDRPGARWQIEEACVRAASSVALIVQRLQER